MSSQYVPASPTKGVARFRLDMRWGQLKTERSSWFSHWKNISDYVLPRNGRFFPQDRDRGSNRWNSIYDSTATASLRTLAAGLMGGMTSPARPWFRLSTSDQQMNQSRAVKVWLDDVTHMILSVFARSNIYRALHQMYEELGAFGTAACLILQDFDNVIRAYPLTAGEYAISTNYKGEVTTLYREFQMTVSQMVDEFGLENVNIATQTLYRTGALDKWITVIHAIEPNYDRDPSKQDARNMEWRSDYWEWGAPWDKYLRRSGMKMFRVLAPRWAVAGRDIYGNSPAMEALGDIKQLQHEQLRKAQGIDFQTNPPLQVPTSMKNEAVKRLPGGVNFVDAITPGAGIRSAFEVNLNLQYLLQDIQDVRQRIRSSFFTDLFLMLSGQNEPKMTAAEVAERHEEKMLMLGPVLERLQNELLDPLIKTAYHDLDEAGLLPPAPPELQGNPVHVELIGILAQAQRAIETNSIDRLTGAMTQLAQVKPEVLDNFDEDAWFTAYIDSLGTDPRLIQAQDKRDAIRAARAKAQQQQQQAAQMEQAANTAQTLGKTPTNGSNALSDVTSQFSGYT